MKLKQIIFESNLKEIIVYLDMDGVLADFNKKKEEIINISHKQNFLQLLPKNKDFSEKEKEIFLREIFENKKETSILDENNKPKVSKTTLSRSKERFWKIYSEDKTFEKLLSLNNNYLIKEIYKLKKKFKFKLGILSSTGNQDSFNDFSIQKNNWLNNKKLTKYLDQEHIVFVPGKKFKSKYANSNCILIDDLESNCDDFKNKGGESILHTNDNNTINKLKVILTNLHHSQAMSS